MATRPKLRKNGIIVLTDRSAAGAASASVPALPGLTAGSLPIAAWSFINGLPEKLQGPGLNAKSSEIAIETLEIVHEGLIRRPGNGAGGQHDDDIGRA